MNTHEQEPINTDLSAESATAPVETIDQLTQFIHEQHEKLSYRPVATVILFNQNNQVLLCKTPVPDAQTPWSFPQGGIEKGETNAVAVQRELTEELGAEIAKIQMIEEGIYTEQVAAEKGRIDKRGFRDGKAYIFSVARCIGNTDSFELDPKEVAEAKWMTIAEAIVHLQMARPEKASMLILALEMAVNKLDVASETAETSDLQSELPVQYSTTEITSFSTEVLMAEVINTLHIFQNKP